MASLSAENSFRLDLALIAETDAYSISILHLTIGATLALGLVAMVLRCAFSTQFSDSKIAKGIGKALAENTSAMAVQAEQFNQVRSMSEQCNHWLRTRSAFRDRLKSQLPSFLDGGDSGDLGAALRAIWADALAATPPMQFSPSPIEVSGATQSDVLSVRRRYAELRTSLSNELTALTEALLTDVSSELGRVIDAPREKYGLMQDGRPFGLVNAAEHAVRAATAPIRDIVAEAQRQLVEFCGSNNARELIDNMNYVNRGGRQANLAMVLIRTLGVFGPVALSAASVVVAMVRFTS